MSKNIDINKYQRLTHKEHVQKRSGMYIGNKLTEKQYLYICTDDLIIKKQQIDFNAGFIKLYDEILTNASDHVIRTNNLVKNIKININKDNSITIENDGPSIPIEKKDDIWLPQMLFGELLSGENYDDNNEKFVGGMNGIGSCLVNILSTKFIIECNDGKKLYYQEFLDHLNITKEPIIKSSKNTKSFTKITYYPDLSFFELNTISDELIAFMRKRAYDIATYCKCNVYFNDVKIPIKNITDFAKLHINNEQELFVEKINDNWEIALTQSYNDTFEQCSIVNGISTYKGGTHVDYIMNKIIKRLTDDLSKNNKGIKIKPTDIKNKFHIFLICKIANPTFDTQTKETLSIKITDNIDLSDKLYKNLLKSEIIESILEWVRMKEQSALNKINKKSAGKTIRVEKLVDAHKAGTSNGYKAALCIAEGDCIDENTLIKVFKDNNYIDIKIKDAQIGDMVITHNGNIRQIYGITKKVKETKEIKYNNTSIICSNEHRLLVYNKLIKQFEYLETFKLDKNIHQLVKSKLYNLDSLIIIKDIIKTNDIKFNYKIILSNGIIESSPQHKFTVLDILNNKFKLVETQSLKPNDLIVTI